jgi:hypothetical protein
MRAWKHIIHVAESAFVKGASTPLVSLVTRRVVPFVIPTKIKQMKKMWKII